MRVHSATRIAGNTGEPPITASMHTVSESTPRGTTGDTKVGRILDRMTDDGWHVIHDVWTGWGTIGHVLVGPAGILTVETTSQRGFVRAMEIDRLVLSRAHAHSKWVEKVSATRAEALLVFSDAWVLPKVSRQWGVDVMAARKLRSYLRKLDQKLSTLEVEATYQRVVQSIAAHADANAVESASATAADGAMAA